MTGPEHYQAAEQLLATIDGSGPINLGIVAVAQVRATLALAAATALSGNADLPSMDEDGWIQAAAEYSRGEQP